MHRGLHDSKTRPARAYGKRNRNNWDAQIETLVMIKQKRTNVCCIGWSQKTLKCGKHRNIWPGVQGSEPMNRTQNITLHAKHNQPIITKNWEHSLMWNYLICITIPRIHSSHHNLTMCIPQPSAPFPKVSGRWPLHCQLRPAHCKSLPVQHPQRNSEKIIMPCKRFHS